MFNFFIFMLAFAIFYALIKKSKVFGESIAVNALVAFIAAFMVFSFQYFVNINIVVPTVQYWTQAFMFILFFVFAFIGASMFYPDLPKFLMEQFTRRTMLSVFIALALGLLITSGFIQVMWSQSLVKDGGGGQLAPPINVIVIIAGIVLFIILLIIASAAARG